MRLALLVLATMSIAGGVLAQADNGHALLGVCNAWEKFSNREKPIPDGEVARVIEGTLLCESYVKKVKGEAQAAAALRHPDRLPVCFPELVPSDADVMVVHSYLKNNPELLHLPANTLVRQAFIHAYPCTSAEKKPARPETKLLPL